MTPRQQNLIKEFFGMVAPIADQAAIIFYDRLFELDPSLGGCSPTPTWPPSART